MAVSFFESAFFRSIRKRNPASQFLRRQWVLVEAEGSQLPPLGPRASEFSEGARWLLRSKMPNPKTNILSRANNELEQILERIRLNCEVALEIMRGIEVQDLSLESREQFYGLIHTLREIVRTLGSDFEKKLMVATAKLGRGLSADEVRSLLYDVAEL